MSEDGALEELWYVQQTHQEWSKGKLFQRATVPRATPEMMDAFWADGWRHFGEDFFRDKYSLEGQRLQKIIPLRVSVARFKPRRDQRRLLKRAERLQVTMKPTVITPEYEALFERHSRRFTQNVPPSLEHFVSKNPEQAVCLNMTCEIRRDQQLLAASFVDIGAHALSSVYAIFEPEERALGLGNMTLLMELRFAQMLQKRHLYTGYGHTVPSAYEYKKRLNGTEYYNWSGQWRPLEDLDVDALPEHPYERQDIPEELLAPSEDE